MWVVLYQSETNCYHSQDDPWQDSRQGPELRIIVNVTECLPWQYIPPSKLLLIFITHQLSFSQECPLHGAARSSFLRIFSCLFISVLLHLRLVRTYVNLFTGLYWWFGCVREKTTWRCIVYDGLVCWMHNHLELLTYQGNRTITGWFSAGTPFHHASSWFIAPRVIAFILKC